ncbi:GNAT superfamily N-acetyltransferase [Neobacillus drentensis]|nr:GNAT superfamily N-acetyltransferase [Neobacillus drentensis]
MNGKMKSKYGQIIGSYVLLPTRPETVELVNIAVIEPLHGKGLGKQLVMNAIEVAKSNGYRTIEVGTGNSSIGDTLKTSIGIYKVTIDLMNELNFFIGQRAIKGKEN